MPSCCPSHAMPPGPMIVSITLVASLVASSATPPAAGAKSLPTNCSTKVGGQPPTQVIDQGDDDFGPEHRGVPLQDLGSGVRTWPPEKESVRKCSPNASAA